MKDVSNMFPADTNVLCTDASLIALVANLFSC
jgi:hypothetical protein